MFFRVRCNRAFLMGLLIGVAALPFGPAARAAAKRPANRFANPSFEMGGSPYRMDKGGGTTASFTVTKADAPDGQHSALVTVEKVEQWGMQFGQTTDAAAAGRTCTFAVLARSTKGPVTVELMIERAAKPWDRAARSGRFTLTRDKWTELHVTFQVKKTYREGWFAYISCQQPKSQFRADMFRLYEGRYVPYGNQARAEAASAAVRLFDTGKPLAAALAADALGRRAGWTQVPAGRTDHAFEGDAVFLNNRLAVALRRGGAGAEVCSLGPKGATMRALLAPAAGAGAASLSSVRLRSNSANGVAIDAAFKAPGGKTCTLACELKMGQVFVRTQARGGMEALRVRAPCRFVVLPDFFADDIVVDARALPVATAELPGEHFLLHMLAGGEAIVMAVRDSAEQDLGIALSAEGDERTIEASRVPCGPKGSVWVGVIEAPGVWHAQDVARRSAGRAVRLDWRRPFPAQWRVDWRKSDGLTDSWEMIAERPDGRYVKHGWFGSPGTIPSNRNRWTTVLGRFLYPCWIDGSGRGYFQPLSKVLRFEGPAVIYPINRVRETPLDRYTVVDIVRSTLGVGPCEYILDVEGQRSVSKGRATCSTRDTLNPIYARGQQKRQRARIEAALREVMVFIRFIRQRIDGYVAFGRGVRAYLAEQRAAHPELAKHLAELDALAAAIDARVARRAEKIKTPAYAARLVEEFRRDMLDYEGPDALKKCKQFTSELVTIGGNQDELVGECRWAVKVVRQRAGLIMAVEPRMAEIAAEIRARSQKVLRNPAGHEGARH